MFIALAFAYFFHLVMSQNQIPMFGVCNNNERCEGTFVCKHHICLPAEDPTPIILEYANDAASPSLAGQKINFVPYSQNSANVQMPKLNIEVPKKFEAEAIARAQAQALAEAQLIWQKLVSSTTKATHTLPMMTSTHKAPILSQAPSSKTIPKTMPKMTHFSVQIPHQISRIVISCKPNCIGTASCIKGSCKCNQPGVIYTPLYGCNLVSSRPMLAVPVPVVQRVPQAKPFETCEAVTECTGGSVCIRGKCLCPPELAHQGEVCVTRIELGLPAY